MVVTRKVRGKKDEPSTSSAEVEVRPPSEVEKVLPDLDEPETEPETETIQVVEELVDIKAEIEAGGGDPKDREKRTPKPSFKVKYATQTLAGK